MEAGITAAGIPAVIFLFVLYLYERVMGEEIFLKELLDKCRKGKPDNNKTAMIINTLLIILTGTALGVLSKLLDNMSLNDAVGWQRALAASDLRNAFSRLAVWALLALAVAVFSKRPLRASVNVFGFFLGMLIGYYAVTIFISGFFPKTYIITWGIITLFTPVIAYFAWYSRGDGWLAILFSSIVTGFFITQAFNFGMWYIDIAYYDGVICLILSIILLYKNKKQLLLSLSGALLAAPIITVCFPYIFGGL